ncbi:hypothetical protein L226DRAFT_614324 [Lentinus tigrinus ALCF2SS1-7]|uniref:uncharacterized protein n=1 Tax=Lentinus tigrinus ALCF2SS1-7 TaxID=1328758 RepID=UPI001165C892|nr:hypothetical protein L226DRAFT_614324 [Lentinus tigrinus ALCF2SS1-7]
MSSRKDPNVGSALERRSEPDKHQAPRLYGLPVDVLRCITPLLKQDDLSRLLRTSKVLYDSLLPEYVKGARISTIYRPQIGTFHRFLRIGDDSAPDCAGWLRSFTYCQKVKAPFLDRDFEAQEGARLALEILRHAPNLTSLTLHRLEGFDARELRAVLANLAHLTYIEFRHVRETSHPDILLDATAPLTKVVLRMAPPDRTTREPAADPCTTLLSPSAATENLSLTNVRLLAQSGPFPAVRTLELDNFHLIEGASTLIRLFPAVRHCNGPGWNPYESETEHGSSRTARGPSLTTSRSTHWSWRMSWG